jgi:hypothetical protein
MGFLGCLVMVWVMAVKAQADATTRSRMFCQAFKSFSTEYTYVVVTVKNLHTGQTKELCTAAPFLQGAMGHETGEIMVGMDCEKYGKRYFEFAAESALRNISFDLYTKEELAAYAQTLDVSAIVQQVKAGKLKYQPLDGERKEQIMFAHLMFNNGVVATKGCFSGSGFSLSYFKP